MKDETTASLQIVEVEGVRGYVDVQGIVWLNAEDVARGLGFTQIKNGVEYVRWETVDGYLHSFEFSQDVGKIPKKVGKGDFIPEQIFYLLAMKASNEVAKAFQLKIATKILPSIRQTGSYSLTADPAPVVKTAAEKIDLARVYLILLSDGTIKIVKIGQSKNIRARVAKIERETGLKVVNIHYTPPLPRETARLVEWTAQKKLAAWHVKGEFFSANFDDARKVIDLSVELATAELPSNYFGRGENILNIADK